jgi:RHH-type rel operon transcriptional repressor/antitoxin RelB
MLAIRLPEEIEKRLEVLAKRTGRTKTFYAREAILEHLDDLEDLYLAESRLQAIRRGEEQPVTLDDLMEQHGLAD